MAPRILTDKFLDKIAKRLTAASEEFAVEGLFSLVETKIDDVSSSSYERNPFTNESIDTDNLDGFNNTPHLITDFKGELSVVAEEDLRTEGIGAYPVGTVYCVINSEEIQSKSFTQERIKRSLGINIKEPVTIDKYGKVLTTRTGRYEIKGMLPFFLRDRMLEITVFLDYAEDRI